MFGFKEWESIDETYFDRLSQLDDIKDENTLLSFAKKNMMLPKVWNYLLSCSTSDTDLESILSLAQWQFYFPQDDDAIFKKIYKYYANTKLMIHDRWNIIELFHEINPKESLVKNVDLLIDHLRLPHCGLDKLWNIYEKNICSLPPKAVLAAYKNAKTLYAKIKAVEENEEKWIEALIGVGDEEFIEQNIECRIFMYLSNKNLWKLYMGYLKEQNKNEKMLETYSKYVRLFLDDTKMKHLYSKEVKEAGYQVKTPWSDATKLGDNDDLPRRNKLEIYDPVILPPIDLVSYDTELYYLDRYYTPSSSKIQIFPFQEKLVNYILSKANPSSLQKLSLSCKSLYQKISTLICYKLILATRPPPIFVNNKLIYAANIFCEESIKIFAENLLENNLKNLFVTTVLQIDCLDSLALSKLKPIIKYCKAKHVFLKNQKLSIEELKFLASEVVNLELENVSIFDELNDEISLDIILKYCPKLQYLNSSNVLIKPNYVESLLDLTFEDKIKLFQVSFVDPKHFDGDIFAEFIKKNASSTCQIIITFSSNNDIEDFQEIVQRSIEEYWPVNEKPKITFLTLIE